MDSFAALGEEDVWVMTAELACAHCCELLVQTDEKSLFRAECPSCITRCDICSSRDEPTFMLYFTRYGKSSSEGPYRDLSTAGHIKYQRLVRKKQTGYVLEMKDPFPVVGFTWSIQHTVVKDHSYFGRLGKCDDCLTKESALGEKPVEERDPEAGEWRDCKAFRIQGMKYLMPSA